MSLLLSATFYCFKETQAFNLIGLITAVKSSIIQALGDNLIKYFWAHLFTHFCKLGIFRIAGKMLAIMKIKY